MLSCGHNPSAHSEYTTGTAHTPDGREICCECADKEQREALKTETHYIAYLSSDGRSNLTTWTGGVLAHITRVWTVGNIFAGSLLRFWAKDIHGAMWYGTSPGPGTCARMHKSMAKK